jgi:hypothetical protein
VLPSASIRTRSTADPLLGALGHHPVCDRADVLHPRVDLILVDVAGEPGGPVPSSSE